MIAAMTAPGFGDVSDAIDIVGLIIAVGFPIAGTAFGLWLAYKQNTTAKKLGELEDRLAVVEQERDDLRHLFRVAVSHIRDWLSWSRDHPNGTPPPAMPDELKDEV